MTCKLTDFCYNIYVKTLFLVVLMSVPAHAQRRAIMENLPASSNSIMVDTANVRVGVGTASPAYRLDVQGDIRSTGTIYGTFSGSGLVSSSTYATYASSSVGALATEIAGIKSYATSTYQALNSTAASLTAEIARATAREDAIAVSTGANAVNISYTFSQLNSTAAALTAHEALTTSAHGGIASAAQLTSTASALTDLTSVVESVIASTQAIYGKVSKSGDTMTGPLVLQKNAFPLLTLDNAAGGYYSYLDGATWNTYGPVALNLNTNSPYNDVTVGRRLNVSSAVASVGFYGPGIGLTAVPANAINGSTYTYRIDGLAAALSTAAYLPNSNVFTGTNNTFASVTASSFTATGKYSSRAHTITAAQYSFGSKQTGSFDGFASQASTNDNYAALYHTGTNAILESSYISGGGYTGIQLMTSQAARLQVTSAGNVGIGTTAPGSKLEVNGTVTASSFTATGKYSSRAHTITAAQYSFGSKQTGSFDGFASQASTNDNYAALYHTGANAILESSYISGGGYTGIQLMTSQAARLQVTSAGNVGIGTTTPYKRLHVVGTIISSATASDAGAWTTYARGNSAAQRNWRIVANNSASGALNFQRSTSVTADPTTEVLTITPTDTIVAASGITASSFTATAASGYAGNGSALTGITVSASSAAVDGTNIASLTDVHLATATATFRGSKTQLVLYEADIINAAGGSRVYTLTYIRNGVTIDTHELTCGGTDNCHATDHHYATSVAGENNFVTQIRSSNATGTQTVNDARITAFEFP